MSYKSKPSAGESRSNGIFFFLMYNSEAGRKDVKEVKLHKVLTGGICKKYSLLSSGQDPLEGYCIWELGGIDQKIA